ncbi:MAG TPA: hypothetical protein DCS88_12040 [Alphaproteobacteria bacterium]|nr:hypothetical protein [Alphaproteobacteria bacterium]
MQGKIKISGPDKKSRYRHIFWRQRAYLKKSLLQLYQVPIILASRSVALEDFFHGGPFFFR